ncbi:something about silencing protein 10 [Umbelopsis sp. WA50703]
MGKKRSSGRKREIFDPSQDYESRTTGKVKAINTWDDIEHDEEDQFHEDREKVLLEYEKQMRGDDQDSEMSEQEVYGLEGIDSDEEDDDEEPAISDEDDEDEAQDEENEHESWGRSKKAYYNAEEGSDMEEMLEEEQEAIRLQKKRIAAMEEEDFVDAGWGGVSLEKDEDEDRKLVESVNKELDDISFSNDIEAERISKRIKSNMPAAEVLKLLQNESPELVELLNEFKDRLVTVKEMAPLITSVQEMTDIKNKAADFYKFKYHLLLNYLTNIAFYLCLKASGTPNIRDHPVINSLVELRTAIEKTEVIENKLGIQQKIENLRVQLDVLKAPKKQTNGTNGANGLRLKSKKQKVTQPEPESLSEEDHVDEELESDLEEDIIDVPMIEEEFKSMKKAAKKRKRAAESNDFHDLDMLDSVDIEDKAAKKRSLRDIVSKIDSKQQKRAAKFQGDVDIPYRDRFKQEKNGVAQPQDNSADLDDADWDESDIRQANAANDDEDLYEQVKAQKAAAKDAKKADYEAGRMPIISEEDLADGDKRGVTWQILKNRGLTPHRKKENRNARVKHRNKYEKKMKKLSSFRAVAKTPTGAYGGETTGIRTGLARSVKFA